VLAHCLGIVGEGLNFLGAIILALEIILRPLELDRDLEEQLTEASSFALEHRLESSKYKGQKIASPGFPRAILDRRAAKLGLLGTGLLAVGFLCLVGYHALEIWPLKE